MVQLTIIKITGYGPWTLTLGSDREHQLQMLQASLYKEIQKLFSQKECLVFLNRFDEFFAVTNGLSLQDHVAIQRKLAESFEIQLSMAIGHDNSPFEANLRAYEGRKSKIVLDSDHRIFGFVDGKKDHSVKILHMDVDGLTSVSKIKSPYEVSSMMFTLYSKMSEFFLKKKSLTFFIGGDNFMIISSENGKENAEQFIDLIKKEHGMVLNCGIGTAKTARDAVKLATQSLDKIRELRKTGKKQQILELSC